MDAITVMKDDHRTVEDLFKKFESAGERAYKSKRKIVDRIITEISVHAAIEEQAFYPTTRKKVQAVEDEILESLEEHHIVKWTLSELEKMDPEDERFDAKVTVLIESVRHHGKEEERGAVPGGPQAHGTQGARAPGSGDAGAEEGRSQPPTPAGTGRAVGQPRGWAVRRGHGCQAGRCWAVVRKAAKRGKSG